MDELECELRVPAAPGLDRLHVLLGPHLHLRQQADHLGLDPAGQRLEHLERLALVLLLRVLLGIAPQPDALAQVVHRREVLLPALVEDLEHDRLLEVPHHLRAGEPLLGPVPRDDFIDDPHAQRLLVQLVLLVEPPCHRELRRELALQGRLQPGDVPQLVEALGRNEGVDDLVHDIRAQRIDPGGDVLGGHQLVAQRIDLLALVVGDVVVLQKLLADVEVVRLHLALGVLDRLRHPAVLDGLAVFHAELLHDAADAVRREPPHEIVLQGQVEAARSRIALPPGTAAELVVDAPGLVALGADDVQPAGGDYRLVALAPRRPRHLDLLLAGAALRQSVELRSEVAAEHDVRPAPGHVGGDGHRARPPGLRDDRRLARVLLRVQHLVRDPGLAQQTREQLRGLDRRGAHQHRLLSRRAVPDVLQHRLELLLLGEEDEVGHVVADHVEVGGDDDDFQAVDLLEFRGLGVGGAGHARELPVQPEVVLEGDRGEGLVLVLDRHPLLGLDRLVQALRPAPARHRAAGEFVDDHDLAVAHDVLDVALEQRVRAQPGVEVVHQDDVGRVVEALALGEDAGLDQERFDLLVPLLGQVDLLRLLVDPVIPRPFFLLLALQSGNDLVDADVQIGVLAGRSGDDEGGAGLVDEDRVDLVDDREVERPLHPVGVAERHVVAQVVEPELVVRRVDDVRGIRLALVPRIHPGDHHPGLHAEEFVDRPHPLRIALREVVVHGDDVHAAAGERIQAGGERGRQGLALAGAHLGDLALVQGDAAD